VRADRLVSLVLLLRQRGKMSADALARELEVSTRTVLRDIEALSTAGVPVHAERGRLGGFALLPGFRTELTGLNHDEALALLTAGSSQQVFGLSSALASAMRKVIDALPDSNRLTAHDAAQRFLIEPKTDLLAHRQTSEEIPATIVNEVRRAVLAGRKLRILYASADRVPNWRTVDPLGLVTVRGKGYLLATTEGRDRTYRLSRITDAEKLAEPAERTGTVDLEQLRQQRSTRFRTGGDQVVVQLRLDPVRRDELLATALAVLAEAVDANGWLRMDVTFQDTRHAEWALWQLGLDAEALTPESLRSALRGRAAEMAERYEN
jgi:predicted DNA-binding transcriptional regulator YafY